MNLIASVALSGCGTRSLFRARPNKAQAFAYDQNELAATFPTNQVLPPAPAVTPPLKAGQWVVISIREPNQWPIEMRRYRVIHADEKKVALEVEILPATQVLPDIYYYELEHYPLTYRIDSTKDELQSIMERVRFRVRKTQKEEFDPEDTPSRELKDAPGFLHEILWIGHRQGEFKTAECEVGRITSKRCTFFSSKVDLPKEKSEWDVVAHPLVPITQFLLKRSSSEVQRVIQFGHQGAESTLLRRRSVPSYLK